MISKVVFSSSIPLSLKMIHIQFVWPFLWFVIPGFVDKLPTKNVGRCSPAMSIVMF